MLPKSQYNNIEKISYAINFVIPPANIATIFIFAYHLPDFVHMQIDVFSTFCKHRRHHQNFVPGGTTPRPRSVAQMEPDSRVICLWLTPGGGAFASHRCWERSVSGDMGLGPGFAATDDTLGPDMDHSRCSASLFVHPITTILCCRIS